MSDTIILGISAYFHDSAAALLRNGEIVAAASEERFSRDKGDSAFPAHAVAYCLNEAGIGMGDVTAVGFYDKPILKFDRILSTYMSIAPKGFSQFRKSGPIAGNWGSTRGLCCLPNTMNPTPPAPFSLHPLRRPRF